MITISGITISNPSGDLNSVYFEILNNLNSNITTIPYSGQTSIVYNEPNNGTYNITLFDGTSTSTCEPMLTVTAKTTGFNSNVFDILQDGSNYVIVGWFTAYSGHSTYSGVSANRIIRLNNSGDIDTSFNIDSGFNNSVYSVIKDSNGKYLVCGLYTEYSGVTANRIIRLNSNGSIDNTFNSGTGFNGVVEDIIVDGTKYVIAGSFTTYNTSTANYIVRLNSDGSIDNTFNSGTGFNNYTRSIIIDGTKYLVGGEFTEYSGVTSNRIIRLNNNGTIDTSFNIGSGFSGLIQPECIIIDSNGKYVIGGSFGTYSGVTSNRIIRLNNNGTIDTSFNIGSGFNSNVQSLIEDSNNKYLVGGYFTTYSGVTANRIIRLNYNGTIDNTFNPGTGFDNAVFAIIQDGTYYILGGYFLNYNGRLTKRIAKLNNNGTIVNSF